MIFFLVILVSSQMGITVGEVMILTLSISVYRKWAWCSAQVVGNTRLSCGLGPMFNLRFTLLATMFICYFIIFE